jgi:hypothetical protein
MIIHIYPINTIPPVTTTTGANNDISNLQFFEALMSAGNENTQQQSSGQTAPAQQASHEATILHENALFHLSPQAISYLNGIDETSASNIVQDSEVESTNIPTLPAQKQQLATIVNGFNNTMLDENMLTQMQGALLNAGINPGQISLQDVFQLFTSPAAVIEAEDNEPATSEVNPELLAA